MSAKGRTKELCSDKDLQWCNDKQKPHPVSDFGCRLIVCY